MFHLAPACWSYAADRIVHGELAAVNNLISNDWHFSPSGSIYIKAPRIPVTPPPPLCVLMFDLLEDRGPDAIAPHVS